MCSSKKICSLEQLREVARQSLKDFVPPEDRWADEAPDFVSIYGGRVPYKELRDFRKRHGVYSAIEPNVVLRMSDAMFKFWIDRAAKERVAGGSR